MLNLVAFQQILSTLFMLASAALMVSLRFSVFMSVAEVSCYAVIMANAGLT